jgi:hypothetical protein
MKIADQYKIQQIVRIGTLARLWFILGRLTGSAVSLVRIIIIATVPGDSRFSLDKSFPSDISMARALSRPLCSVFTVNSSSCVDIYSSVLYCY